MKVSEIEYLCMDRDGMVAVSDCGAPTWKQDAGEWRSSDAFAKIPPAPDWLKPGQLWERAKTLFPGNLGQIKRWAGVLWNLIEDHKPEDGVKRFTVDLTPSWEFALTVLTQSVAGELENDAESRKSSAAEIVRAGKILDMLIDQRKDLVAALEMLMSAYEAVLPGIGSIVVKDYMLINDAPCAARAALAKARGE